MKGERAKDVAKMSRIQLKTKRKEKNMRRQVGERKINVDIMLYNEQRHSRS